ncbi:MAG TPA: hypothetical protein VFQ21_07410 [Gemmatimonadota bacterium]|nr:hypothetical protein [Gemmatimonadota bacterium]
MRFTWIALPLLLATLATPGAAAAPSAEGDRDGASRTDFASSASSVPVAAMPAPGSEISIKKISGDSPTRHAHVPGEESEPPEHRPASLARVRIRAADRAAMAFLPDLARELNGLLSACTTACPPPESR